jgi:hypothetical protein
VIGDNHKGETLYGCGKYPDYVWKGFGDKETHPKYEGDVDNGKPNGLGILTFRYGTKYVGEWKDGKPNGLGILTYRYGTKYKGYFKDWVLWNGTDYDKDGNIKVKYVNGKYIKQ